MRHVRIWVAAAFAAVLVSGVPSAASAAVPRVPPSHFKASDGCGCHAALLDQWRTTMHSKALSDPVYQAKLADANHATNGTLGPFCETCHGPIAAMAGQLGPKGRGRRGAAAEGITCDFCHQLVGTSKPIGNFSWIIQPVGVKRAQFKDAISPVHKTAYSAYHEKAEFCGACHDVRHPGNGLLLEATYTEWRNGPYAKKGIVCQDCHMTPGPGVTKPNPGRAAALGPERAHIYTMTWAGGNVGLGNAILAEERLKGAATLRLEGDEIVKPGGKAKLAVTVTNSGAGHYLPTGLTEVRECWLQVTVTGDDGEEVLSERRDFNTVLKDARGKYPAEVWNAVAVQSDTRIPPQGSKSFDYEYTMPAAGHVVVAAVLNYRSCSEKLAEEAGVKIPTTEMAAKTLDVFGSEDEANAASLDKLKEEKGGRTDPSGGPVLPIVCLGFAILGGILFVAIIRGRRHSRKAQTRPDVP